MFCVVWCDGGGVSSGTGGGSHCGHSMPLQSQSIRSTTQVSGYTWRPGLQIVSTTDLKRTKDHGCEVETFQFTYSHKAKFYIFKKKWFRTRPKEHWLMLPRVPNDQRILLGCRPSKMEIKYKRSCFNIYWFKIKKIKKIYFWQFFSAMLFHPDQCIGGLRAQA